MQTIKTIEQLESIYSMPSESATAKVVSEITDEYRAYIDASPFLALATCGPDGMDCSPRGDQPGFVRVIDRKTVHLPDRHGNNRVDSLRNIIHDARIALLFMIPGCGNTLRINGEASICIEPSVLKPFAVNAKLPRSVIVVTVHDVYFQCARAIMRSQLWNPDRFVDPKTLPSPGQILSKLSGNRLGGERYDKEWPERAKETLW